MKQTKIAGLIGGMMLAFLGTQAHAQSSVTLWGVADVSLRYLTNSNAKNDNRFYMTNGAITNSRFALKGTEDLGGGLKAIFNLESGFDLQSGQGASRLFNRAAYVGLASQYGTVTLGRQKTLLFDLLADTFDPLTVGNYFENAWLPVSLGAGLYADNAVKYNGKFGGLSVGAMYSFGTDSTATGVNGFSGQVPGHVGAGNMYGFSLGYAFGPLNLVADMQQNSDNSSHKQTVFHAGAVYAFSTLKLYAGYIRSKDDTGFADSVLAQQATVPGIASLKGTGRIDDGPYAGLAWQATPTVTLTGAFYYDHARNETVSTGVLGSGNRYAIVGVAEYALSKRTEIYGTVDFNKATGASTVQLPGRNNQTGVAIGLRNIF